MSSLNFVYGMYYMWFALRDSNGYGKGDESDPDNVAAGVTTHAYLVQHPISFTPPTPTYTRAIDRAGQTVRAQKDMGPSDFGEGTFVLSELDETLKAIITGAAIDTATLTAHSITGSNVNKVTKPALIVNIMSKAYDVASDSDKWLNRIFPNCQILPPATAGGSQSDGENPNPLEFRLVPNTSLRYADGHLLSAMNMSLQDDKDLVFDHISNNPMMLSTFIKDGAATTFVLGYKPSTTDTGGATNAFTNNGVDEAMSSVVLATGLVTLSAAGNSADILEAFYETEFETI